MTSDGSQITTALHSHSNTAVKWTHINLDQLVQSSTVTRDQAIRKLQQWHDAGAIELQLSGVVHRFRIVGNFPKIGEESDQLIATLYEEMQAREQDTVDRVKAVIALVASGGCICRNLAKHFGDEKSVPKKGCGHCHICITGEALQFSGATNRKGREDMKRIKSILAASKVRDDARFLAKVAFGISSPRITAERMGRHQVFGSMDDCDFEVCVLFPTVFFLLFFPAILVESSFYKC